MVAFDERTWRDKALERFKAKGDAGAARFLRDQRAVAALERMIGWCTDNDVAVRFSSTQVGSYEPEERVIVVSSRESPESQLFTCLHEWGHVLIYAEEAERFRRGWAGALDPCVRRKWVHRATIVIEEDEAWERGLLTARGLGLGIDEARYDAMRVNKVKTYFNWAMRLSLWNGNLAEGDEEG